MQTSVHIKWRSFQKTVLVRPLKMKRGWNLASHQREQDFDKPCHASGCGGMTDVALH
jgi:hypothetical protein